MFGKRKAWRFDLLRASAQSLLRRYAELETENEKFFRFHVEAPFDGPTERALNREKYNIRADHLAKKIAQCELVIKHGGQNET